MTLEHFDGAVTVITGGASGIGLACARALYGQGAHVVLADNNTQGLQKASQLIQQENPTSTAQVIAVPTDVTDEGQVQAIINRALDIRGGIDLVITCAGLGRGGLVDQFSAQEMALMMDVNFMGTFHCVRAALPNMRAQHSGHFVFLSSVAGKLCPPILSGYAATKWAVRGFSSALRAELYGSGIGVTTVYPAWVDTPMIHQEDTMGNMEIEALLTAEQVAEEIVKAVREDKRDLTLAPNQDIALLLQIMDDDQDKAEDLAGAAFQRRIQEIAQQQD
ncbi:MAG: SDR family oxidoreductase [Ktedonobacteraceae bacterium]|nr:SDR family oxidoreductase [Ktedonobacteraceae bacterium]MBO0796255.1 SDR family oxidoreductase [Ktedonobacteraceae bacterium]